MQPRENQDTNNVNAKRGHKKPHVHKKNATDMPNRQDLINRLYTPIFDLPNRPYSVWENENNGFTIAFHNASGTIHNFNAASSRFTNASDALMIAELCDVLRDIVALFPNATIPLNGRIALQNRINSILPRPIIPLINLPSGVL